MKRYLILITIACAFLTACNKSTVKTTTNANTQALTQQQLSQRAVNIYKSIIGQYGGANLANGLNIASTLHPTKGLKVSDIPPFAVCGTTIPTTSYSAYTSNDTAYVHSGNYSFTYLCDTAIVIGYKNNNQFYVTATDAKAQTSDSLNVIQQYTVQNGGGLNEVAFLTNGQITTFEHHVYGGVPPYTYFGQPETANYIDNSVGYTLTNVKVTYSAINVNQPPNITSGIVAFTSTTKYTNSANYPVDDFNSTGTITFEAYNNLALIDAYYPSVDRHFVVTVNVLTGQIVP